jgi:hypothetical protein
MWESQVAAGRSYVPLLREAWNSDLGHRQRRSKCRAKLAGDSHVQRFWRCTILELAIRYVDHGRVRLAGHEETQLRIKYLGQAIRESTKFAFAYTCGTKRYFEDFWCHEANTEDYFRAHEYALDKRPAPDGNVEM